MVKLAHFSDPHLQILQKPKFYQLLNKRITGWINWNNNRSNYHSNRVLECMVEDISSYDFDQIICSGDLINISLCNEFLEAEKWLRKVALPDKLMVVPGNHDNYVRHNYKNGLGLWRQYMQSNDKGVQFAGDVLNGKEMLINNFPYLRIIGQVALIGLNSARPMPPFVASGYLGKGQLDRLVQLLNALGKGGYFRMIVLHHKPIGGTNNWLRDIIDVRNFQRVINDCGAEVIIHGHHHRNSIDKIKSKFGDVPVIGVPSASAFDKGIGDILKSHYYIYDINKKVNMKNTINNGWQFSVTAKAYNDKRKSFDKAFQVY